MEGSEDISYLRAKKWQQLQGQITAFVLRRQPFFRRASSLTRGLLLISSTTYLGAVFIDPQSPAHIVRSGQESL